MGSTAFVVGLTRDVAVNCVFSVMVNTYIVYAVSAELLDIIICRDVFVGCVELVLSSWFDEFDCLD